MSDRIHSFNTANLTVSTYVEPEQMDPADSFEFDEDIEAVRNGDVEWFCVKVEVRHSDTGALLGLSTLGGCAYKSIDDFVNEHRDADPANRNCGFNTYSVCHYFPDMIREACGEARATLRKMQSLTVRENA
jgi:hypothetical protein